MNYIFIRSLFTFLKRKDDAFIHGQDLSQDFNANILRGPNF